MTFPPIPTYPEAIDSDQTLFLVYNTTETKITEDNAPWAQEISILPVESTEQEIWANNGFANINGELLYYDSVEKNDDGKVFKLKKCARNLGGEETRFNKKCSWIRSYVVAEHHNQLVNAILQTEDFIGYNFDPRQETLDWRIRNLQELQIVFDDYNCPDVNFTFNIVEDDPVTGKLAEFLIEITPPGTINTFRLDFGDGDFTTTDLEGSHRYALNASVDPVVSVANDKCQLIQTPIERVNPQEPQAQIEEVFDIPIPEIPEFPDFTFVPCDVPEPDINLPPTVFPCVSLEGQVGPIDIPSFISIEGPDINLVSNVTITGIDLPDGGINITQSVVEIIGGTDIPSIILIDPPVPPTIIIDPPIPPTIVIVPPSSSIVLALDAHSLPRLEVDWGMPPEMEVALTLAKSVKKPTLFSADQDKINEFGEEFADLFEASNTMKVEYESVGIPEEIKIIPPRESDMPKMRLDVTDVPEKIKLDSSEVDIPKSIKIFGPDDPIPNTIRFDATEVPEAIDLIYKGTAIPVKVETEVTLKVEEVNFPSIKVEMPQEIPSTISMIYDGPEVINVNMPQSIMLEIPENAGIPLLFPEEMPQVELVYKGSPVEVKITMDEILNKSEDGRNCVMITPCPIP